MREIELLDDWVRIRRGQAWLIEQSASDDLSELDRDAIAGADVVFYDRALASLIAAATLLPGGSYAEPLAVEPDGGGGPAISRRALNFAAAGWSVVQLVQPRCGWRQRLRDAAAELAPLSGGDGCAVRVIAKSDADRGCGRAARLPDLQEFDGAFAEGAPLTLIVEPRGAAAVPTDAAFTANGLAG